MTLDVTELGKALEAYGYSDLTLSWPTMLRHKPDAKAVRAQVRMKFTDWSEDPKLMRRNLLHKYEAVWELLTERFGLMLGSHPTFEIRGALYYTVGSNKPTPAQVYAEADYDCWIP